MKTGLIFLTLAALAPALTAQSRPLVMRRGDRTLVLERVQLAVDNVHLVAEEQSPGIPVEVDEIRVDLRSNVVEFKARAPAGGPYRQLTFDLRPEQGWSVRVVGTMDTTQFDLQVPLAGRVTARLLIPRRVRKPEDVTLRIRLPASTWFRDHRSGLLIDPAVDEERIIERIRASLPPDSAP